MGARGDHQDMKKRTSSLAAYYVAALKGLEQEKSRIDEEIQQVRNLLVRHTGGAAAEAPVTYAAKKTRNTGSILNSTNLTYAKFACVRL